MIYGLAGFFGRGGGGGGSKLDIFKLVLIFLERIRCLQLNIFFMAALMEDCPPKRLRLNEEVSNLSTYLIAGNFCMVQNFVVFSATHVE